MSRLREYWLCRPARVATYWSQRVPVTVADTSGFLRSWLNTTTSPPVLWACTRRQVDRCAEVIEELVGAGNDAGAGVNPDLDDQGRPRPLGVEGRQAALDSQGRCERVGSL